MLQALKLDAQPPASPRNREAEPGQTGLEGGFAAFLAQAAWLPPAPPPAAPAPPQAAKSAPPEASSRPEASQRPDRRPQDPALGSRESSTAPEARQEVAASARAEDQPAASAPAAPAEETPAQEVPAPGAKPALPGRAPESAEAALPSTSAAAPLPAREAALSTPTAPEAAPAAPAAPQPPQGSGPRSGETLELRLRVEPEAARAWSATGSILRPLQEFLAQPRPPLETPAPLRDHAPAAQPSPEPSAANPTRAEAAAPRPEGHPASPALAQAALAGRVLPAGRDSQARAQQAVVAASGTVAVRAAVSPEAPRTLTQPRNALPALQVEGSIRWMLQNRHRGAELHLHPESLGRVTIRLTVEGTEVHARVWASEASTLPLLQEHRTQLEQALKDQGLNLGSFDLNQGARGDASREPHKPQAGPAAPPSADPATPQQDLPTSGVPLPGGARLLEVFA